MKKYLWIFIVLLFPFYVEASTILLSEDRKPIVGSTFVIDASVDYGNNKLFHYIHYGKYLLKSHPNPNCI